MLANALNLAARYDEGHETVVALLETAKRYRLTMPVPHAFLNKALAQHGRREYAAAYASLNTVMRYVGEGGDAYLEFSVRAIRARVLATEGRLEEAIEEISEPGEQISGPPLRAEYLASQSMVLALAGRRDRGQRLARAAVDAFPGSVEARVLAQCVAAINVSKEPEAFLQETRSAWTTAERTGNFDGLVCAYRAHPSFLTTLFKAAGSEAERLVKRARDIPLARRRGIRIRVAAAQTAAGLTPREQEVFELLRSGLSNRAIAQALFVSEATVKVHLRHIYEKLGVRTRSEALAHTLTP
jgi:ATP/maltotriose-dependent transcriptional regulator MalT